MKNYYEMLGVSYTSTRQEIKKVYLAMLKQYHPDIFKGNKKIAQDYSARLNVAYDTLSNSKKRLEYDKSIFPIALTSTYTYNEEGVRVALQVDNKKKKKHLPAFSFFGENTINEKVSKVLKKSPQEKRRHIEEQKQAKKLEKFAKKTEKENKKRKLKQLKQKQQQIKLEKKKKKKMSLSQEKLVQKNKRKLDTVIIVIASILIIFIGVMVYLNLAYKR